MFCKKNKRDPVLFNLRCGRKMASNDDDHIDFRLVTTYIPLFNLFLRAIMLMALYELRGLFEMQYATLFAVLLSLVYLDTIYFKEHKISSACGGLVVPAVAIFLSHAVHKIRDVDYMHFIFSYCVDTVWAIGSSLFLAANTFHIRIPCKIYVLTCCGAVLFVLHVQLQPPPTFSHEIWSRVCIYYMSSAAFFYTQPILADLDRNIHHFSVMHVNMHLVFVRSYVLFGSTLIFIGLYVKIYCDGKNRPCQSGGMGIASGMSTSNSYIRDGRDPIEHREYRDHKDQRDYKEYKESKELDLSKRGNFTPKTEFRSGAQMQIAGLVSNVDLKSHPYNNGTYGTKPPHSQEQESELLKMLREAKNEHGFV